MNVKRDLKVEMKELREQADIQINYFWRELKLGRNQNEWLWEELHLDHSHHQDQGPSSQAIEMIQQVE